MKVSIDLSLKDTESIIESAEKLAGLKEIYRQTDVLYNFAKGYSPQQPGGHFRITYCTDSRTEGQSVRIVEGTVDSLAAILFRQKEWIEEQARQIKLEVGK